MDSDKSEIRIGLIAAVTAHVLWGVFPIFWRQLGDFDSIQVVCHRVLWSFVTLMIYLPFMWRSIETEAKTKLIFTLRQRRTWFVYAAAGGLIALNWLTFIWAVNDDRVLEASLGYYINPLLNVLIGVWILGERLSGSQWLAIGCATLGVAIMTVAGGGLPWVSLVLACSFATYALIKKKAPLPALLGLLLETTVLLVPAFLYIAWVETSGTEGAFAMGDVRLLILLALGGTVTIAPLALFAFAAQRAPLSAIGVLQYIAPTMQFLLGVFLYSEPFDRWQLIGFIFVWIALGLYMLSTRRAKETAARVSAKT
jgi:chloramphenicol-sensitive protein RarD